MCVFWSPLRSLIWAAESHLFHFSERSSITRCCVIGWLVMQSKPMTEQKKINLSYWNANECDVCIRTACHIWGNEARRALCTQRQNNLIVAESWFERKLLVDCSCLILFCFCVSGLCVCDRKCSILISQAKTEQFKPIKKTARCKRYNLIIFHLRSLCSCPPPGHKCMVSYTCQK